MRLPILFVVHPSCQCPPARSPTLRRPGETPEVHVQGAVADESDRAAGRGFAIGTTPGVAAECGAPLAGEADAVDCLEEALEVDLRPSGDTKAVSTTSGISSKSSSPSMAGAAIFGKRTRRLGRSALLTVQLACVSVRPPGRSECLIQKYQYPSLARGRAKTPNLPLPAGPPGTVVPEASRSPATFPKPSTASCACSAAPRAGQSSPCPARPSTNSSARTGGGLSQGSRPGSADAATGRGHTLRRGSAQFPDPRPPPCAVQPDPCSSASQAPVRCRLLALRREHDRTRAHCSDLPAMLPQARIELVSRHRSVPWPPGQRRLSPALQDCQRDVFHPCYTPLFGQQARPGWGSASRRSAPRHRAPGALPAFTCPEEAEKRQELLVEFQPLADRYAEALVTRKYSDALVQSYISSLGQSLVLPDTRQRRPSRSGAYRTSTRTRPRSRTAGST